MYRKTLAAALLPLLFASAVAAEEPVNAEALVAKNLAARGGAEALAALKSVQFEGKLVFPGDFQLTYTEVRSASGASRSDATVQGLTLVQAYDGQVGWRINPFEGRRDAERLSDDEARSMADSGLVAGPLQAARSAGSSVAYLGREDFDGTLAYKLRVSQKDGDEFIYLLDPDSFLEIKIVETRRIRGAQIVTESELGDYEAVAGVLFPMSVESWAQGQANQRQRVLIAAAKANVDAPAATFAQPASPATVATTGK